MSISHARYDFTVLPTKRVLLKAQLKSIFVKKPFEKRFKIHGLRANRLDTSGDLIDSVDIILRKLAYILAGLRVSRNGKMHR